MKEDLMKYYKLIGKLQVAISTGDTLDSVLKSTVNILKSEYSVDDVIIWYKESDNQDVLHPNYWISPADLTSKAYKSGEGVVGSVYKNDASMRLLDFEKDASEEVKSELGQLFYNIGISSMVCVPLSNKYETLGCIQFINEKGGMYFTEEDADLFDMLSSLIALQIDENQKIQAPWKEQKIILSVKDVKKEFQNGGEVSQVLKGVNLDIYEGEFVVLLGESGCGKSTLLNIIGGLDSATSGKVVFMDKEITDLSQDELAKFRRDNIGFIFQSYNLMPNLTAKQNLDLIAELVSEPMNSKDALALVGLGEKLNSYPSQLSGGQQQRISIARAIVKKPKIIMADEPTAALDYSTSIEVLTVMENIIKTGTTLIMVTHNEEIAKMADRVIRMRNGKPFETTLNRHPVLAKELVW